MRVFSGRQRWQHKALRCNQRNMSFNGHTWISLQRYGFPHAPQLGSFALQYCTTQELERRQREAAELRAAQLAMPVGVGASPPSPRAAEPHEGRDRTLILDDRTGETAFQTFSREYQAAFFSRDAAEKAAKMLMRMRRAAIATMFGPSAIEEKPDPYGLGAKGPLLTADLIRNARGDQTPPEHDVDFVLCGGVGRGLSALDRLYIDDARMYCRALVYASGGSRLARDWIAGMAAMSTHHPSLLAIALQHRGSPADVAIFAQYCNVLAGQPAHSSDVCDVETISNPPQGSEDNTSRAASSSGSSSGSDSSSSSTTASQRPPAFCIDLPEPIPPQAQADIVRRCFLYDALTALHFMEFDADLLDLDPVREAAAVLGVDQSVVSELRQVAIVEHTLIGEKHRTLDSPPSAADHQNSSTTQGPGISANM